MPSLVPFRGVLLAPGRDWSRRLCPPYDVVSPALEKRLRATPGNAVHLELPEGGAARYLQARALWERWLGEGRLEEEKGDALYLTTQRFNWDGRRRVRLGLLGALELGGGGLLAHERTLPKPKADRLRLLESLRVNTSPIFCVCPDPGGRLLARLRRLARGPWLARGRDAQGVEHGLKRLSGARARKLGRALGGARWLIADGHHRREVARLYARSKAPGSGSLLAYVCPPQGGLLVLPTHRVLSWTAPLEARFRRFCRASPLPGARVLERALARERSPYAFGLYDGRFRLVRPAPGAPGAPSGFGADWLARRLLKGVDPGGILYFHRVSEAVRAARREGRVALLLKPVSVAEVRRAALKGLLPQKSTYFYPKIATGLVFRPLEGRE